MTRWRSELEVWPPLLAASPLGTRAPKPTEPRVAGQSPQPQRQIRVARHTSHKTLLSLLRATLLSLAVTSFMCLVRCLYRVPECEGLFQPYLST